MSFKYVFLVIAIITLSACQSNTSATPQSEPQPTPITVINHTKPKITVDLSPFRELGCDFNGHDFFNCKEGNPSLELGCEYLEIEPLLGGLTPNYSIARCSFRLEDDDFPRDDCIFYDGVASYNCIQYIIYKDGEYIHIKTMKEFRSYFAPVDSPEEALGFALATGNYSAKYGHNQWKNYFYYTEKLEDSYVQSSEEGYLVHLFELRLVNCERLITDAVDLKVTADGLVELHRRYPVYRNLADDGICVE
jgi:hypothetical protein